MNNITKKHFLKKAHEIATELGEKIEKNFESFLGFVYDFPIVANKKAKVELREDSSPADVDTFLRFYLKQNFASRKKKVTLKEVQTVADPAVDVVLEVFGKHQKVNLGK